MGYARHLFDQFPDPSLGIWNTLFKGYVQNELYKEVLVLFHQMLNMNVGFSCFTFPMVLKSCGKLGALREGEEVHCLVLKIGFKCNTFVGVTMIDMYSSGGAIGAAYRVFSEMTVRNVVSWTSMVNGYMIHGDLVAARRLFDLAPERDLVLWNTMFLGYLDRGNLVEARKLFDMMPHRDLMSWNTMLHGYANNGDVKGCERLFEEMPEKNIFSWNGLIGGYARNGCFFEVLNTFKRMLNESNVCPNDATIVSVLSACSRLGALDLGKWVHLFACDNGYEGNVFVGNGLIDMYAKCGMIEIAINVFKNMDTKDLISWNTIINGLAVHGHGANALSFFHEMKNAGKEPDGITFLGVLCACSHMGLVQDGFKYFHSMVNEYSIMPRIEHYGCLVDLLARAGFLQQAVDFIRKMPMEADVVIWTCLLGACKNYKNVELAELALHQLIALEPKNPANYVVLSNIYGDAQRWKDVARSKVAMRDSGSRKLPGCSLVEVDDNMAEFYSFDERHPKTEDIYGALKSLSESLKSSAYDPDLLYLELDT